MMMLMMMKYVIVDMWLKGIDCPRAGRTGPGVGGSQPADEYGDEALTFTRDLVLQREVSVLVYYKLNICCLACLDVVHCKWQLQINPLLFSMS